MIPIPQYSFLSAFIIGLLHVLEPCEDKAVASIYVAWSGKKLKESLILIFLYGLGMIAIDTSIGFLVSFVGLNYLQNFQPILRYAAGIFTIIFGLLMILKSHIVESHCYIKMFKNVKPVSRKSVLTFGLIRGLPLCPIEIVILIWAASVGDVIYGTLLVFVFSVGTLISLIPFGLGASGLLSIIKKRLGETTEKIIPIVIGLIVILAGIILFF